MKKKIKIFNTVDQLSQYFAKKLIKGLRKTPEGAYFSIALSGGSTPRAIFQYLALHFKDIGGWEKLLVFWGDERCVPPDSDDSNFKMASESLLNQVPIPKDNIFRIKGEDNPLDEARRYSDMIHKKVPSKKGSPLFDLVMLGLGTDGHTASIFPGSQHLFESDQLCKVAQHPESLQTRITVTGKVINQARTVAFLVTGEAKAAMVSTLLERKDGWEKFPASQVRPENGKLLWLLDEAAASDLKNKL